MTDEEHITALFRKDPEEWTKDDVRRAVAKYRELKLDPKAFDAKTGEPKPKRKRKAKVDPRQIDFKF